MLLSPVSLEDYLHRIDSSASCQPVAMKNDSSDEQEVFNNELTSSTSSDEQTKPEMATSLNTSAHGDTLRVSTIFDDSFVGMQALYIEKDSVVRKCEDLDETDALGLKDNTDSNDDDDEEEEDDDEEDDEDSGWILFGLGDNLKPGTSRTPVSNESRDIHTTKTERFATTTKTKVGEDEVEVSETKSILDVILQTAGTQTDMADRQRNATSLKPGETAEEEFCCICRDTHTDPVVLPKCSHKFCRECIGQYFKIKPVCPECFVPYGIITGNQPEGHMDHDVNKKLKLQGSRAPGAIVIYYSFDNGTQTKDHPKPGHPYHGTSRTAYLPDTPEGNKVLRLLTEAFKRRLVFTVGRSRTTGADDQVTWNDIHHKTSPAGGQESFGYPDETYLNRVQAELAAVGVTEDSLTQSANNH